MDAVLHKRGDKQNGTIDGEYYNEKLENKAKEAEEDIQSAQTPGQLFKTLAKQALSDTDNAYGKFTGSLELVKRVLGSIK